MAYYQEFKPRREAFVTYRFLTNFALWLVLFLIPLSLTLFFLPPAAAFVVFIFVILQIYSYIAFSIQFRKEKYVFLEDKIIHESGSIFSSRQTELAIRNLVQVRLLLPFVEHALFRTGHIRLEAAGIGVSAIKLASLNKPQEFYAYIEKLMRHNGFKLAKKQLVQQEKPSSIGVFFEVFSAFFAAAPFLIFGLPLLAGAIAALGRAGIILVPIVLLVLGAIISIFLIKFLDLKQRVYRIYTDTITYSEGFLSKNFSFIPVENLADSEVRQRLLEKIFGLYDIVLSAKGASTQILFKNMRNGPKLEENIDKLIAAHGSLIGKKNAGKVAAAVAPAAQAATIARKEASSPRTFGTGYTAEFQMHLGRTMFPIALVVALAILLFPAALITSGKIGGIEPFYFLAAFFFYAVNFAVWAFTRFIKALATTYEVKRDSMEERYDFLSTKHKEFSNEKITGIIFKENYVDKLFGTCSIDFWSIGTAEHITFSNIKKTPDLHDKLTAKVGIGSKQEVYSIKPAFSYFEKLKAGFWLTILKLTVLVAAMPAAFFSVYFLLAPAALLAFETLFWAYSSIFYRRVSLTLYRDCVHYQEGLLFRRFYYVLPENIRGIETSRYPFSGRGSITFDVAGEHVAGVMQGSMSGPLLLFSGNRHSAQFTSNSFTIEYVDKIGVQDELIDLIFYHKLGARQVIETEKNVPKYSPPTIMTVKPALANSFAVLVIVFAILTPVAVAFHLFLARFPSPLAFVPLLLIPVILVVAVLVVINVKAKSYFVQAYRVVSRWGIVYRKEKSILFSKIDHINYQERMLNKLFKNGTITVNTTGSSKAEMIIANIPRYREFYEILKKHY